MTAITKWALEIITSARSGKARLYIRGNWPDGKLKTTSAVVSLSSEGVAVTRSGSEYLLEGPDRWGETLQEAAKGLGVWVPADQ
jgi:hypothetical protein